MMEDNINDASDCIKLMELVKGGSYDFAALVLNSYSHQLRAWIDYNNDGIFDNTTEQIHYATSFGSAQNYITSATFVVPNTATVNTVLRLRVIEDLTTNYGTASISGACINPKYGQGEDYPIYIQDAIILPVKLINFTGKLADNKILLAWSTVLEKNIKDFEIEKSTDGINYYPIGKILAAGSDNSIMNYSFEDSEIEPSNFYRVRMNDVNGQNKLSAVILISNNNNTAQKITLLNNPFSHSIDLKLAKMALHARVQLINVNGSIINEKEFFNTTEIHWEQTNLSNGMYILRAIIDGREFSLKILKQ